MKKIVSIMVVLSIIMIVIGYCLYDVGGGKTVSIDSDLNNKYSSYKVDSNNISLFDLYFLKKNNNGSSVLYSPFSIKRTLRMISDGSVGASKREIDNIIGNYSIKQYNYNNMSFYNTLMVSNKYGNNINKNYIKKYASSITYGDLGNSNFIFNGGININVLWNNSVNYSVTFRHEKYSHVMDKLPVSFNNSSVNGVKFGADINKYDVVNSIGKDKIKDRINKIYNNNDLCDNYIKELGDNYNKVYSSSDFTYYINNDIKSVGKDIGGSLEYVAIMPRRVSLKNYIKSIETYDISRIINNLKGIDINNFEEGKITEINGYLPIYGNSYDIDMKSSLEGLGISSVFDSSKVDLSGMLNNNDGSVVSGIDRASINFNDNGNGNVTINNEGDVYMYDVPVVKIDLSFDNPYMYLVRDKDSGEILLMGSVYNK